MAKGNEGREFVVKLLELPESEQIRYELFFSIK